MNKKAIYLISVFVLLASLQLACSFSDLLGNLGREINQPASQESISLGINPSENGEWQEDSSSDESDQETSYPAANQSGCTKSFVGSTNISDGQEFQAGDTIQASITLINTGTCTWDAGYNLIEIGGDLVPSISSLALSSDVEVGDSVQLQVSYSAPSQSGPYLSIWKMKDADGGVFGQMDPTGAPLRIKIRVISSGNSQPSPTPNPTPTPEPAPQGSNPDASLEMEGVTLLEDHCYDLNSGSEVDCSDGKAHIRYSHATYGPYAGHNMTSGQNTDLSPNQSDEPQKSDCQTASYYPLPHPVESGEFFCFKIGSLASTLYGWIRIESFNDNGVTFDFLTFKADPPTVAVNTNLFVESQGEQITLMEGQCYDVWNGEKNLSCSGTFAGFLFEEVTKKSLQVSQISPNEMYFSGAMSSEPTKSECLSATYSTTPIWPIQATSYYCYQFVPGTTAYYGWLRPTSFNLGGLTFDYLTWETIQ